jgi:hypothetical protein
VKKTEYEARQTSIEDFEDQEKQIIDQMRNQEESNPMIIEEEEEQLDE